MISVPKDEFEKAKLWRLRQNLTVAKLAELTGYADITIYWFERGETPPGRAGSTKPGKVDSRVWQRFKNCCAGVEAQLARRKQFGWGE